MIKRGKTGLVLGSGGARGWAHIGVIRALRELDIEVSHVAGTSMGALVGAAYASGHIDTLHQVALSLDWTHIIKYFFEFNFPRSGLIDGKKIINFLRTNISTASIESLLLPFCAVAADVQTGKKVVLSHGDLIQSVRASISIPGIFSPVRIGSSLLVDGGLLDPVPVDVVRTMGAEFTIAVNLNRNIVDPDIPPLLPGLSMKPIDKVERQIQSFIDKINRMPMMRRSPIDSSALQKWFKTARSPDILDVLGNSIRIMESQLAEYQLAAMKPDILIEPRLHQISFMDFHRAREIIEIGYHETVRVLNDSKTIQSIHVPYRQKLQDKIKSLF